MSTFAIILGCIVFMIVAASVRGNPGRAIADTTLLVMIVGIVAALDFIFSRFMEILSIPVLGVIPESESVLKASNTGTPVILDPESPAGRAYDDAVARFLGDQRESRFLKPERRSFFRAILGRA